MSDTRARVMACIEQGDWAALSLPTPDDLTARLLKGEHIEVEGHFVTYEPGEYVWYTNPYGVDGILCAVPNVDGMRSFLIDMACGNEYGQIPVTEKFMERDELVEQGVAVYRVGDLYSGNYDGNGKPIPEADRDKWLVSVQASSPLAETAANIPLATSEHEAWAMAAQHYANGRSK